MKKYIVPIIRSKMYANMAQEGFIDDAMSYIRKALSAPKPNAEKRNNNDFYLKTKRNEIVADIKRTYMNSSWMSTRKQSEETINPYKIYEYLVDGNKLPDNISVAVQNHLNSLKSNYENLTRLHNAFADKVNTIGHEMISSAQSATTDDEFYKIIDIAVGKLSKLKDPGEEFKLDARNMLGNPKKVILHGGAAIDFGSALSKENINPLKIDTIPTVAQRIIDCVDLYCYMEDSKRVDILDGEDNPEFKTETGSHLWELMIDYKNSTDYFWHSDRDRLWEDLFYDLSVDLLSLCVALEKWIYKSIK